MKLYIIAGEASGDLHAANLVDALIERTPDLELRGWGGDRMEEAGVELVKHIRDLAFMGFAEVVMNLKTILNNVSFCKEDIRKFAPDAIILIDYPGFNLRIAPFAKKLGIKVLYYISPQVWAWKSNRVHAIKKNVDEMYTILPFEAEFYKRYNMEVQYVGHPLLDEFHKLGVIERDEEEQIALLPGSRKQEISKMLPIMIQVKEAFPSYSFTVAAAPGIKDDYYREIAGEEVTIVRDSTYELLRRSKAALVTSGTATLETALIGTPEVVCYKGNAISYQIAKRLVKLDFISLVNLIMGKEVVKELIQNELNRENLISELGKILADSQARGAMKSDFIELKGKLGGKGASGRCADHMLKTLSD